MYYRHDDYYYIIEKSKEELKGDNVLHTEEDFDLDMYDIIIGYISDKGEILRHTKKLRSVDVVLNRLADLEQKYSELLKLLDSKK
jgi:hypothetical protein